MSLESHRPRKRFGQHFLRDQRVIGNIVGAFAPKAGERVVEIGPGPGALTALLMERVTPLHVVELDRDLVADLRKRYRPEHLIVHEADALRFDFATLAAGEKLRLIGNLPYNISTPLLFHVLDQLEHIGDMLFMLQKEVVDRMAAAPDTADYGRLSVMIQWRARVEPLFDVPPEAFFPPPRVESSVVRVVPHAKPPIDVRNARGFEELVKAAFAHRRKTLRNNLKEILPGARMEQLGIDPNRRAETLTLQEFATLANDLA
jgi:16S rRNA (adenine1518-N6/adenine1519-N6)-dimethyltransferase